MLLIDSPFVFSPVNQLTALRVSNERSKPHEGVTVLVKSSCLKARSRVKFDNLAMASSI